MELIMYKTNEDDNVIGKTLTEIERFPIEFKKEVDIINPVLLLRFEDTTNLYASNYMHIELLGRYYFIRSIDNVKGNVWSVSLECDVLETYKDDILISNARISRDLTDGDYFNTSLETEIIKEIDMYKSDTTLSPVKNIILSTIGSGE